jgi:hypothetical protein
MQEGFARPRKTAQFSSGPLSGWAGWSADYTAQMSPLPRYLAPKGLRPSVPDPMPVAQAMRAHAGLVQLGERLEASRRRLRVITPALPGNLIASLQSGPLDEEGWSLLAANAAVAAKLRHLLPRLEALLAQAGLPGRIRIKLMQK